MRVLSDSRAQSVQIGAVLLFGILIILLSTWQAFVIPDQNEGIEFNHNQDVQQQMTELRTTVNSMPDATTTRSATVDLGLRYPSRTIFRNPPPVSGTLLTDGTTDPGINISIANAEAANTEPIGTENFWNGTTRSYTTGTIEYQPAYYLYNNAPTTIYDQSVLYNRFEREQTELPISDQTILQNGRLSLVALNGSLSETRVGSTSVDFEPLSTQTETVEIQQANDTTPIAIEFPTRLNESRWRELIPSRHTVTTVAGAFRDSERSLLRIELDESRSSYRLQLAKVGVGTGTTETASTYITGVGGADASVTTGKIHTFTVEVRDEFNKPLSAVQVSGQIEDQTGTVLSTFNDGSTGTGGQTAFTYNTSELSLTPGEEQTVVGNFSFDGGTAPERFVALNLTVSEPETTQGTDPVAGPTVSTSTGDQTVTEGQTFSLDSTASSVGDGNPIRSGTPIQSITYNRTAPSGGTDESGPIQSYDPDNSNRTEQASETFNTTGWVEGDHSFTITAQDASGRTTTIDGPVITIQSPPENAEFFSVSITSAPNGVAVGDDVTVEATIENIGGASGTQDIVFSVNGTTENTINDLSLNSGESTSRTFTYTTDSTDRPEITVEVASENDSDARDVIVNEALKFEYATQPSRGESNDDVTFSIRNTGNEVTLAELEVRDVDNGYSSYNSYTISPPQTGSTISGSGPFNTSERVSHTDYAIANGETATIDLRDFDTNNMNNNQFQFVIYTDDGRSYEFTEVSIGQK